MHNKHMSHSKLNARCLRTSTCLTGRASRDFGTGRVPSCNGSECRGGCKERRWQNQRIPNQPTSVIRCLGILLLAIQSALQAKSHLHEVTNPQFTVKLPSSLERGQRKGDTSKEPSKGAHCNTDSSAYIRKTRMFAPGHQIQPQQPFNDARRRQLHSPNCLVSSPSSQLRLDALIPLFDQLQCLTEPPRVLLQLTELTVALD